jgi:hypothetical protein
VLDEAGSPAPSGAWEEVTKLHYTGAAQELLTNWLLPTGI